MPRLRVAAAQVAAAPRRFGELLEGVDQHVELELRGLSRGTPTLAERFQRLGYTTLGLAANINIGDEMEFDRGFARSRQRTGPPPKHKKKPAPQGVHYEWDEGAQAAQSQTDFGAFVDQDDFLAVGQWVRHPQWGRGQIVEREGHGDKMKLSIKFSSRVKRVAVAYAQLEPA